MLPKKRSFAGKILNIIVTIVVIGFLLAVLSQFDWDIFAVIVYIWDKFMLAVTAVADFFSNSVTFRNLF